MPEAHAKSFLAINPADGREGQRYGGMTEAAASAAIDACHHASSEWKDATFAQRADCFRKLAGLLRTRTPDLAPLITREMGKPLAQSRAELEKCASTCEYFAEKAETMLADETLEHPAGQAWVTYQPLGVILGIMPWNFPFWQVFRAAAPTMMAGNAMVVKHSSNVPGSALAIETLFRDAGFPPNLFRTLMIGSAGVPAVISHPAVRAVTLTGSTAAGAKVAALAGAQIKKTVLELGGSDPYLVLADADLAHAARSLATGKLLNAGQSCIAVKRIIVIESVREAFEQLLVKEMRSWLPADPMEDTTRLGPMARSDLRDELHTQVTQSIQAGARLLLGGETPAQPGAWYPPTILSGVTPGMTAADEELFGPVAAIMPARDEDEAIRLAHQSPYGLGGGIFSQDTRHALKLAREALPGGTLALNGFVQSDPRIPFGGTLRSGYGRELAILGIKEFVNARSIVLNQG